MQSGSEEMRQFTILKNKEPSEKRRRKMSLNVTKNPPPNKFPFPVDRIQFPEADSKNYCKKHLTRNSTAPVLETTVILMILLARYPPALASKLPVVARILLFAEKKCLKFNDEKGSGREGKDCKITAAGNQRIRAAAIKGKTTGSNNTNRSELVVVSCLKFP